MSSSAVGPSQAATAVNDIKSVRKMLYDTMTDEPIRDVVLHPILLARHGRVTVRDTIGATETFMASMTNSMLLNGVLSRGMYRPQAETEFCAGMSKLYSVVRAMAGLASASKDINSSRRVTREVVPDLGPNLDPAYLRAEVPSRLLIMSAVCDMDKEPFTSGMTVTSLLSECVQGTQAAKIARSLGSLTGDNSEWYMNTDNLPVRQDGQTYWGWVDEMLQPVIEVIRLCGQILTSCKDDIAAGKIGSNASMIAPITSLPGGMTRFFTMADSLVWVEAELYRLAYLHAVSCAMGSDHRSKNDKSMRKYCPVLAIDVGEGHNPILPSHAINGIVSRLARAVAQARHSADLEQWADGLDAAVGKEKVQLEALTASALSDSQNGVADALFRFSPLTTDIANKALMKSDVTAFEQRMISVRYMFGTVIPGMDNTEKTATSRNFGMYLRTLVASADAVVSPE